MGAGPARGFLAGVAGAGMALLASLSARFLLGLVSIPELTASLITAWLPAPLFGAVLVSLRYVARPLLLVTLTLGFLGAGGVVGILLRPLARAARPGLPRWHPLAAQPLIGGAAWGPALALALAGAAVLASALLPASGLPVLGGSGLWLLAVSAVFLAVYLRSLPATGGRRDRQAGVTRRLFLENLGLGAAAVVAGTAVVKGLGDLARDYLSSTPTGRVGPFGTLSDPVTPNQRFYVVSKNVLGDPALDAGSWRLEVRGRRTLLLDQARLLGMMDAGQYQTLECISNEVGGDLVSTARWEGVRLASLLAAAGIEAGHRYAVFQAADGYSDSLPLDVARDAGTIVALRMNGSILPQPHGFPARLLIPGRYGMKNVKWLTSIELAQADADGYWQQRGWSKDAVAKTMSRFDLPQPGRPHPERPIRLGGVAYAGRRGVTAVQVSVDGGPWQEADVRPPLSTFTWAIWTLDWLPAPGRHRLRVRAVDGDGTVQPPGRDQPIPTGASGYHEIEVDAG
jgi:DMSO/TMAO reductase YedYZ molybdopterin-dependent catalytic subunit